MPSGRAQRQDAFVAFMAEASPSLTRTAWLLTGDADAAQELVQAALVKTYVAWPRVQEERALAYARTVLVNHHREQWRKRHREVPTAEPGEGAGSRAEVSPCSRPDDRDDVVRRLAHLPDQQRIVVVLRYYADQSERDVAELLGISVGAVKSAASRGLARLRDRADLHPSEAPSPASQKGSAS